MKLYVSGGMTNIPEFNFPLFDECAADLRAHKHTVYSPADNDRAVLRKIGIDDITQVPGYAEGNVAKYNESIGDTKALFRWDFNTITNKCDGIVMLPGWEVSTGARWERVVAEALGLNIWLWNGVGEDLTADSPDRLSQHLREFPQQDDERRGVPFNTHPELALADLPASELVAVLSTGELFRGFRDRLRHVPRIQQELTRLEALLAPSALQ